MDGLRSWAASVIAAAVLTGVLEFLLPRGRFDKPVRTLIALTMLIAFFSPFVGFSAGSDQMKSGLDELLQEANAQQALADTVRETLEHEIVSSVEAYAAQEQITVVSVKAKVRVDSDNNIAVRRIDIVMNGSPEEQERMDDYVFGSFSVHPVIVTHDTTEGRNAENYEW